MKLPKYPLVKVFWLDSHTTPSWVDVSEISEDLSLDCVSVGFLIHESKDVVVIAAHISVAGRRTEAMVDGAMTIPRRAITKIVKIR